MDNQPIWPDLQGGVLLGGEGFVEQMGRHLSEKAPSREIPRRERLLHRPSLEELFADGEEKEHREKAAFQAHIEWGYPLKDIAEALGVHYSTVSRMVRRYDSQMCYCKT